MIMMDTVSTHEQLKSAATVSNNCIYLIIISDVNISSLVNKVYHYRITTSFSCRMKGGHLIERKSYKNKQETSWIGESTDCFF